MLSPLKSRFHRLQAMNVPEIWYRTRQAMNNTIERHIPSLAANHDSEVLASGIAENLEEQRSELLQYMRRRNIFPWQSIEPQILRTLFEGKARQYKDATLSRAQEIIEHRFRIFDRVVIFEDDIDWHWDVLGEKSIPLRFWSDIDYHENSVVAEVKYVWELNRHQHFITLAKAYWHSGEEKYAAALLSQWQDWIVKNPVHYGINWCSALEAALRLVSWTWALQLAKQSQHLSPELYLEILHAVDKHARFISGHLSRHSSANNHLIGEALGLIYAGSYFPELKQAPKWRRTGFEMLFEQIPAQVHPDGVCKEQAIYYQLYLFDFAVLAGLAAKYHKQSVPSEVLQRTENMAHFIASLMDSAGNVPALGDGDGGRAVRLSEAPRNPYTSLLATAATLFHRPDFQEKAKQFDESAFWLCGADGMKNHAALESSLARPNSYYFPNGGYVILHRKEKGTEQRVVFDCGPLGYGPLAAHGHADALSLTMSVGGKPILIDCGTYLYLGAGDRRKYFRGTSAHNTLVVDDKDQSTQLGFFQWGRRAKILAKDFSCNGDNLFASASHDGYRSMGVVHHRQIKAEGSSSWRVEDRLEGAGMHKAALYFHLAPCKYEIVSPAQVRCIFGSILLEWHHDSELPFEISVIEGQTDPPMGWHSPSFGSMESHPVIVIAAKGLLPVRMVSHIHIKAEP
jgi:hypothetical protein